MSKELTLEQAATIALLVEEAKAKGPLTKTQHDKIIKKVINA